jgi:tRNA(Ile)-lysidine synthase TilS/MesJ
VKEITPPINFINMKQCNRCLFDETIATIHDDGICNYCRLQEELALNAGEFTSVLDEIRKKTKGKQYDCLIGISGGADSSILLYMAVKYWKLNPLVIHLDNRWNTPTANNNMKVLVDHLNVNSITFTPAKEEFDTLNDAFLAAGLPDADIPNDIAMMKLSYEIADQNGIKYLLLGHDYKREGSTPVKWTYMDSKYLNDVYFKYTGKNLKNYPLISIFDQIYYGLKGIKQIRPFHYKLISSESVRAEVMAKLRNIGWKSYGSKHCENVYTEYVGSHLLPVKFGIDKRIVYLSAQIREGMTTKENAKLLLARPSEFDFNKLGVDKDRILTLSQSPIGKREDYAKYNFKAWKPVIWVLAKLKVLPYTFYIKYCK